MAGRAKSQQARLRERFLEEYRVRGNVTGAARAVGVSRSTVYRWREADARFAAAFLNAEAEATDTLEAEARRRAVEGVKRTRHRYDRKGTLIAEVEEIVYSDALLMFLLRGLRPEKYRERFDHRMAGADGAPLFPLAALRAALDDAERAG